MQGFYYKVVDKDLKSLGMKPKGKPVSKVQYAILKWARPLELISKDPDEGGGLYVNQKKSTAFALARYFWRRYGKRVKVFICVIGEVLCEPSDYRLKTDKVMLVTEVSVNF